VKTREEIEKKHTENIKEHAIALKSFDDLNKAFGIDEQQKSLINNFYMSRIEVLEWVLNG